MFYTLYQAILTILKLIAPITPFITEELYQRYYRKYENEKSIHLSKWPKRIDIKQYDNDTDKWKTLVNIITLVRKEKSKFQKSMKAQIILTLEREVQDNLKLLLMDLKAVTNAVKIREGKFNIEFL